MDAHPVDQVEAAWPHSGPISIEQAEDHQGRRGHTSIAAYGACFLDAVRHAQPASTH